MNIFEFMSLHPFLTSFIILMIALLIGDIVEKIWCPCKKENKDVNKKTKMDA